MDSSVDLQQPILDGGIRSINFFNGRMLTARDLTREQTANREVDRRLGQAVGEGIAYGLEVSKSTASTNEAPVVAIESGLAVNRQGQTLWLRDKTDVALVRKASASVTGLVFSECKPLQAGTYVAGAGVYLLTVAPAETREGRAVTSALNTGAAPCNTDAVVSAVQFRLIQINPPITTAELQDVNHLRNLIAYKCFGVTDTQSFVRDPFGQELTRYGLLDSLRPNLLTDCDVPLGVLYWTLSDGIKFIDMWSVRRRIAARSADSDWSPVMSDRRHSEAEAMFLQFEEQVDALRRTLNPDQTRAVDQFRYLPPVGIIPLATNGLAQGFHGDLFFDTLTRHTEVYIEGARVEAVVRAGLNYPPVDLAAPDRPVMLWVYRVRENRQTVVAETTTTVGQPYLVFSSGHMANMGDPHFDVNRWDFSNYA